MQHKSNRRISRQLLFSPHPQEEWPQPFPPQILSSRRIQMMEHPQLPLLLKREPHPELHPLSHPQFVAVKSLMRNPPCFSIQFTVCRRYIFVTGAIQILRTDPVPHNPIPGWDKNIRFSCVHRVSDNFSRNGWSEMENSHCHVPYSS